MFESLKFDGKVFTAVTDHQQWDHDTADYEYFTRTWTIEMTDELALWLLLRYAGKECEHESHWDLFCNSMPDGKWWREHLLNVGDDLAEYFFDVWKEYRDEQHENDSNAANIGIFRDEYNELERSRKEMLSGLGWWFIQHMEELDGIKKRKGSGYSVFSESPVNMVSLERYIAALAKQISESMVMAMRAECLKDAIEVAKEKVGQPA